jgi:hypothetical protein
VKTGCETRCASRITELAWSEVKFGRLLLHDSKTGARTVWLGDEARLLLSTLERSTFVLADRIDPAGRRTPLPLLEERRLPFWV